jgi:hypothetical protein
MIGTSLTASIAAGGMGEVIPLTVSKNVSKTPRASPHFEFSRVGGVEMNSDIEGFLNVGLNHKMRPGQLLHANPPFCIKDTSVDVSLRPCPAEEVILLHARFAKEIADSPDGARIEIRPPQ